MRRARRLVLGLALLVASPVSAQAPAVKVTSPPAATTQPPPPWMPAPPPPVGGEFERRQRAKQLRRQSAVLTGVGIALFGLGVALNVVALDVLQGTQTMAQPGGGSVEKPVYAPANWGELAGGLALMGTGFALVWVGVVRGRQAQALEGW